MQFIRDLGDGIVWAGIEGALLESGDNGATFDFRIHYPIESSVYPYIREFVPSSQDAGTMVIGGFDKGDASPYLAYSTDRGRTWLDVSAKLPYEQNFANVSLIAEDREGQMFLVLQDGGRYTLRTIDVGAAPSRLSRRSALAVPSPACGRGWREAPGEGAVYSREFPSSGPSTSLRATFSPCLRMGRRH